MGWMNEGVGLKDPEPVEPEEQPLTVLEWPEVVLLLECENETSPAVFVPKS